MWHARTDFGKLAGCTAAGEYDPRLTSMRTRDYQQRFDLWINKCSGVVEQCIQIIQDEQAGFFPQECVQPVNEGGKFTLARRLSRSFECPAGVQMHRPASPMRRLRQVQEAATMPAYQTSRHADVQSPSRRRFSRHPPFR